MRKLVKIVLLILAILLFAVGFRFAADNAVPISIQWFAWSSPELPTFLWLIASMFIGFLLGYLGFWGKNLALRLKLGQSRSELKRRSTSQNRIVPSQSTQAKSPE